MLVEVARREIFEFGYEGASLRRIARRAQVDPSLVRHYFGSKENLLLYAIHGGMDLEDLAAEVLRGTVSGVGRRTVRVMLMLWDHPETSLKSLVRISASLNSTEAAAMMRDDFIGPFFGTIARAVSPDQPDLRASLAATQMLGLAFSRYLVGDPVLAGASSQDLIRTVGRVIQGILVEPLPRAEPLPQ